VTTGHVLLGLLSRGQRHGYELKREHDALFPAAKELAFGQAYAALARLRDKGFVEEAARERVDGPDRTAYRITAAGREELAAWLADVEPLPDRTANPVATKVTLLLLAEGTQRAVEHLLHERAVRVARMRELTAAKHVPGTTLQEVLAADHTLAHLDADLRWIESARRRIHDLEGEIA
jgi:DNA-binding PadR family transcriptional regulator